MKKSDTDRFKHLPPQQQYVCLKALSQLAETPLESGVIGIATSVMLSEGHTATLSKFACEPDEVSVIVSWEDHRKDYTAK